MRLAIVTAFPPSKITLNEYGYHLVKNFAKRDDVNEIILYTNKTSGSIVLDFDNSEKIKIVECWKFNSLSNIYTITKSINHDKPDHVLFNLQFMKFGNQKAAAALGLLCPLLCRLFGFKTTVLLHNILETVDLESAGFTKHIILKKLYNAFGFLLTKSLLKTHQVVVTIPKYQKILSKKYKQNNIKVIPHGTFDNIPFPEFKKEESVKRVLAFGKFGTYKKVEILIEAIIHLRETTDLELEIIIAGTSHPNVPNYLTEIAERYSNIKQLKFTGYVDEKDVPKIFKNASIVVFPYESTTGSSGVLHQAGSFGKAVVLPQIGDLKELIKEEGYTGEFFIPNNVLSLSNAIANICKNPDYQKAMGLVNYKAASLFSMDKICERYMKIFN